VKGMPGRIVRLGRRLTRFTCVLIGTMAPPFSLEAINKRWENGRDPLNRMSHDMKDSKRHRQYCSLQEDL
jgi:hypothetical protein